jgi:hypothetical protein
MKILFLVQKEQRIILDRLYDAVAAHSDCDLRWLSSAEQGDLRRYFREKVEASRYERILFFLRFKKEMRHPLFIRSVPNLVILEHDAWQDDFPGKYRGKFSAHYRRLPAARVLASGWQVTEKLKAKGVDAVFVSKGYDPPCYPDQLPPLKDPEMLARRLAQLATGSGTGNRRRVCTEQGRQRLGMYSPRG